MKQFFISALLAAALCIPSLNAHAQNNPVFSDSLTIFDQNGAIFAQVNVDEADETASDIIWYVNDPTLANPAQYGNATTLVEGDGSFSDIFGVVSFDGGNTLFLGFNSDTEDQGAAFGAQGSIFTLERDGVFDATQYLNSTLQAQGWTATFKSDPSERSPEPASWAVIGFGVFGVAGLVLRKRGWRRMV